MAEKGYDPKYGARPLNRAIQKYLEDPIAEEILKAELTHGDTIIIDHEEGKETLSFQSKNSGKGTTDKKDELPEASSEPKATE